MKKQAGKEMVIHGYRYATWPLRRLAGWQAQRTGTVPVHVLFYHRVCDDQMNQWTIRTSEFERQIGWLARHFDIVSLQEAQQRIVSGHNTRATVSLTFDDGYADNSLHAIPLLMKRRIPFTYFVCLRHIQTGQPFDHDLRQGRPLRPHDIAAIRLLANSPQVEIGAHTRTHADLGAIADSGKLFDEVIAASRELGRLVDRQVRYFAFPYGQPANLQAQVFHMLRQHGFAGACSAYGGCNEIGGDAFHLQRMHGDPMLARVKNWLTFDPRTKFVKRYDYGVDVSEPDATAVETVETQSNGGELPQPRLPEKSLNLLDTSRQLDLDSSPTIFSNTDLFK